MDESIASRHNAKEIRKGPRATTYCAVGCRKHAWFRLNKGYPEIFSFSQALEISRQYVLLQTVILQNIVAGCPLAYSSLRDSWAR